MRITYNRGLRLDDVGLWLDARDPRSVSFVSHAHADHIARHDRMIASPATARLAAHRQGAVPTLTIPFGERRDLGGYHATLFPAGHVLGSAQLLVERDGERLVYTGDFKLRASRTSEPPVVVPCETLVMEATFGEPVYRFPDDEEVAADLCREIDDALAAGQTPVVIGYALGKGQEALALLVERGYRVAVDRPILEIAAIYSELGVAFAGPGAYGPLGDGSLDGAVLLVSPGTLRRAPVRDLARKRTLYLSGWGMSASARYRYGVDRVVPFSDHAGYDELLRYVAQSGARRVVTVYGRPDFSRTVARELGVEACHLDEKNTTAVTQMALFG
jgi:Cft2 family RNA processing exonuclease